MDINRCNKLNQKANRACTDQRENAISNLLLDWHVG